ncbi:hypothetical protein [Planctomicrobium sp. SH664]|uniref:hypothetical protein n=1 Tax=Planctomicrobium sp. SH664 TaxID=3448125 RepID=UPI003F5B812F
MSETTASPLPPPEEIRRLAEVVLSRPDYTLEEPVRESSRNWTYVILKWLLKPLVWVFDQTEGLPDFARWLLVVGLAVVLCGLVGHLLYTLISPFIVRRKSPLTLPGDREETVRPEVLEKRAEQEFSVGRTIEAVRLLFRATLLRLQEAEKKKLRPGYTNSELLRKYRSTPHLEPLRQFVDTINTKWYGEQLCLPEDFIACREGHRRVVSQIRRRDDAHSP